MKSVNDILFCSFACNGYLGFNFKWSFPFVSSSKHLVFPRQLNDAVTVLSSLRSRKDVLQCKRNTASQAIGQAGNLSKFASYLMWKAVKANWPNCLHTAFRLSSCFFNNFYCVGCFRKWFTLSQLLTIRGSINTSIFQVYKSFHFILFELFKSLVLTHSLKQSSVMAADGNYNSNFCGVPWYSHSPKICYSNWWFYTALSCECECE